MTTNDGYTTDDAGNVILPPESSDSGVAKGRALYEKRYSPKKRNAPSVAVAALIKRHPFRH